MGNRLGEYLRTLRHRKGLSTRQLATQAKCSASFITLLEQGQRQVRLDRLWQIVEVLEGDFHHALSLLCLDSGIPEEVIQSSSTAEPSRNLPASEDDPTLWDLLEVARQLSPQERRDLLEYALWRYRKQMDRHR